jgi:nitroreductase
MSDLIYARKNPQLIQTLLRRRSVPIKLLGDPGPTADELKTILSIGTRTPDHGKLFPWWFITFEGEKRARFGDALAVAWQKRDPQATPEKLDDERKRLMRVPLVIAVISSPRESTIPVWEQELSAGAVCQNILLAANALGYGANWLTNWYSFDDNIRALMNLRDHEKIAGFIYIGTPLTAPDERDRPDLAKLINSDFTDAQNRGNAYAKEGLGFVNKK